MADAIEVRGALQEAFRRIRLGFTLENTDIAVLVDGGLTIEQECAALAGLRIRDQLSDHEAAVSEELATRHPAVASLFSSYPPSADSTANVLGEVAPSWRQAVNSIRAGEEIGFANLQKIVKDVVESDTTNAYAAALLMAICVKGMSRGDVANLTSLMASSGTQIDYRGEPALKNVRLVRRYPTGGLSEKVALILPALIATAREHVNVASPFLVAKSLGHTGGTWDKLSSIPGFRFPSPGSETVDALLACGVAMVVTHGNINPADRKLYQLRSATETIESIPLIVASIASKHLSLPVHQLLLDVRVGEGAFLKSESDGIAAAEAIKNQLKHAGIDTTFSILGSFQPNGSAVGNAVEVAEAVAVMNGARPAIWDERALLEQRLIVVEFFSKLMSAEFPERTVGEWARYAFQKFSDHSVLRSFERMLDVHGVAASVVQGLVRDPFATLNIGDACHVRAREGGVLRRLHQFKLGDIVNRILGGGGNEFEGTFEATSGLILAQRLWDPVVKDGIVCSVFSKQVPDKATIEAIRSCFDVV